MSGKTLILLCLLLALPARDALAQFKGLLLLGDLRQGVVLDYLYSGQESLPKTGKSLSSSQNRFTETYNAGIEYSILHPLVLNGHLKGSFGLDQEIFSSPSISTSTSGNRYLYDLDGVFFKRTPTPVNFTARSEFRHVQRPFTPGYDINTESYTLGASLRNKILPLRIDYQNTSAETSGTSSDTRQENSLLALKADHSYKNSITELHVSHTISNLEPLSAVGARATENVAYTFVGKNTLVSPQKDKTLSTSLAYRGERQLSKTETFSLGESFLWQLGKALTVGATYENSSVSTSGVFGGGATDTTQQSGSLSLTHMLFKSLSTRLKLQGRVNDRTAGRETEYTGNANFFYTKKLSAADNLTLNYAEEYSVIDRHLTSGGLTAIDEPLTAQLNGNNLLQQPNVDSSTIIVRDQTNPLIRYDVNSDYRIIQIGAFTGFDFSVIGSRITDGQRLLVTYQYNVDASVEYRRSAHGGGGAITFQEGTYQLYASVSQSTQEITSGQEGILRPTDSLDFALGATRNKNGNYANVVYVSSDSTQIQSQYIEGTFRLTRYFAESSLNAQAKDRQSWFGATSYNPVAYTENQFLPKRRLCQECLQQWGRDP